MSLVDSVFGGIPAPLISQWGKSATYVKQQQTQDYDPITGTFKGPIDYSTGKRVMYDQEVAVKIVVTELSPDEMRDGYQQTDVKILLAASSLPGYYPQITDCIKYIKNGVERTARIVGMLTYEGDSPIMHALVGRFG